MVKPTLSFEQNVQESEYTFPYHYIPNVERSGFTQTQYWSWGMNYMAGIELVLAELVKVEFDSIVDVGCGDGRFLREVVSSFPEKTVFGIDYSTKAIALAKALNPTIPYACVDITTSRLENKYDVITMVEVLEHIPVEQVGRFLIGVSRNLKEEGTLILTVPHKNKQVNEKHYQHFSINSLKEVLSEQFNVEQIIPFDRLSRPVNWLRRLLGHMGSNYIITNKTLNNAVYKMVLRGCIEPQPEQCCGRLLAVVKVKS